MHATSSHLPTIIRGNTSGQRLAVYVVATTVSGTSAALDAARSFAAGFDLRITLLVPQVVPYPQSLDHPADSVTFTTERFRRLAAQHATDVLVRVCLCRSRDATLAPLLPRDAVVLVGGPCRRWWPTREQRLAEALSRDGREMLFVRVPGFAAGLLQPLTFEQILRYFSGCA